MHRGLHRMHRVWIENASGMPRGMDQVVTLSVEVGQEDFGTRPFIVPKGGYHYSDYSISFFRGTGIRSGARVLTFAQMARTRAHL